MAVLYSSTRGGESGVSASQAILKGLACDGGLFVPNEIPVIENLNAPSLAQPAHLSVS